MSDYIILYYMLYFLIRIAFSYTSTVCAMKVYMIYIHTYTHAYIYIPFEYMHFGNLVEKVFIFLFAYLKKNNEVLTIFRINLLPFLR
jgi:hypothetical protein